MKMLNVLFGAAAGVVVTISVGAGVVAAAPDVVGQTFRDAKSSIQAPGAAVVIATRPGGLAETDKCIVTNAWDKPSVTQPRQASGPDTVWVALSCNAAVASPGLPGKVPPARKAVRR